MKATEIFDKILETRRYCMNQRHGICDGCPYETEVNCQTAIKADIKKVRERLGAEEQIDRKPKTNADKIRSMTDEELAQVLHCQRTQSPYVVGNDSCETTHCIDCTLAWLKQEVSEC